MAILSLLKSHFSHTGELASFRPIDILKCSQGLVDGQGPPSLCGFLVDLDFLAVAARSLD